MKTAARMLASLVLGVLCVSVTLMSTAGPAGAHSELVRSDPPDGGMVGVGRTELSLWFGQALDAGASRFLLHTVDGQPIEVTVSAADDGRDGLVGLHTTPLERGLYVLDWQAVSAEDGHASHGSLLFGAGTRPDAVPTATSAWPGWPTLVVRWVGLLALLVAIGAVAVTGRVLAACAPDTRRRALRLGVLGCALGLAATAATPFVRTPRAAEPLGSWVAAALRSLADTRWGQLSILVALGLLVAGGTLLTLTRHPRARWPRPVAALALSGVAVADAAAGHAADLPRAVAVATAVTAVHLVAAGVWLGGLVVLAACVLPLLGRASEPRRRVVLRSLRSFSPAAAVSAAAVLGSGLYLAGQQVPDLHALRTTWYGAAAGGKTVAVALTLGTAAFTTLAVNPRLAAAVGRWTGRPVGRGWSQRVVRLVGAELVLLTVAVALAALMTSTPTARARASAEDVGQSRTATVDGIFLTFESVPAGAGENRVVVRTRAVTRPQPGPVTGVDVLLVGPDESSTSLTLRQIEDGRFEGATAAPGSGTWQAWFAVRRPSVPDAIAQVTWSVAGSRDLDATALERLGTTLGWLLMAVAGAGGLLLLRSRGTGPPQAPEPAVGATGPVPEREPVATGPRA